MVVQADAAEQAAMAGRNWYAYSPGQVNADLHVDPAAGLSAQQLPIARLSASRVSNSPTTT
jgi:hypothetical protein